MKTEPPAEEQKREKQQRVRFSIWYLVAALLLIFFVQTALQNQARTEPYSEFKKLVQQKRIAKVVVPEDGPIRATLKANPDTGDPEREILTHRGGLDAEGQDLAKFLDENDVKYTGEPASQIAALLSILLFPLLLLLGFYFLFIRRMGGGPETVLSLGKSRAKIYAETDVKTTFKDVAGADEAVEEVREIVEFLRTPDKFKRLGAQIPKGILLVGFPGTGKTLLARALAGEARVPFFHLSGSDFVEMFAGLGAARVRDLFKQAKEKAPCIIFVDELDALGKTRTHAMIGSHEEREQTLNALLVEMDGFEPNTGVVLIGATNRPEILDPALLRPGRFDRQVVVDRPDQQGRLDILKVHAKNKKLAADVELRVVAQRTVGMVGADLASILNEAALLAGRKGREEIQRQDIDEAIDRVMAGLEKKKRLVSPKEREIVAFHEAGHALCGKLLPGTEKNIHKVSIVPRGPAALGLTWYKEAEDRYIHGRSELEDQLVMTFGGRSAEEVVFGEVSTGAANDIERATDIARRMVAELGMSEKMGLVSYDGDRRTRFLDLPGAGERTYSEATAREIDLEVKAILDLAHARAKELLARNRAALDRIAKRLLDVEVIDRDELERLIHGDAPAAATAPSTPPAPAA